MHLLYWRNLFFSSSPPLPKEQRRGTKRQWRLHVDCSGFTLVLPVGSGEEYHSHLDGPLFVTRWRLDQKKKYAYSSLNFGLNTSVEEQNPSVSYRYRYVEEANNKLF